MTPAKRLEIRIGYIARQIPPPPLYDLTATPPDQASAGARLAQMDNNTTGAFLGQHFDLIEAILGADHSAVAAAHKLADAGVGLFVADLPADELLAVADALKDRGALVLNVAAEDDSLRGKSCRANVFHLAPSRAMLTDALAQFLSVKHWARLFLIVGPTEADRLCRGLARLGEKIRPENRGGNALDLRRAGAGARRQHHPGRRADLLPSRDSDIIVVADEADNFGDYIPYRTADPKLVTGTQGLIAASWHRTQFAFGAEQLQDRFLRLAKRQMRPIDYQAWMAVRAIGEAVVHVNSTDPRALAAYMLEPDFALPRSRAWRSAFAPGIVNCANRCCWRNRLLWWPSRRNPGFLHQRTPLDTLGVDEPETECRLK